MNSHRLLHFQSAWPLIFSEGLEADFYYLRTKLLWNLNATNTKC